MALAEERALPWGVMVELAVAAGRLGLFISEYITPPKFSL